MKSSNEIFFNQCYKDNKFIQYKNDDENIFNILYEKLKIDLNEEMIDKIKNKELLLYVIFFLIFQEVDFFV